MQDNKYDNLAMFGGLDYTVIGEHDPGFSGKRHNGLAQQVYNLNPLYEALRNDPVAKQEYIDQMRRMPEYNDVLATRIPALMAKRGYAQNIIKRSNERLDGAFKSTPFYKEYVKRMLSPYLMNY